MNKSLPALSVTLSNLLKKSVEIDKELFEVYNEWKQINQFGFTKQRENSPMI